MPIFRISSESRHNRCVVLQMEKLSKLANHVSGSNPASFRKVM